ncbi:MAG: signal peptidase I [Candidatus Dormibacteria bacterium]
MGTRATSLGSVRPVPTGGSAVLPVAGTGATAAASAHLGATLRHGGNLAFAAFAAVLVIFATLIVTGAITRHHFEQVITGSMVPAIPVGSLVVTQQVAAGSLQVGNVLVFTRATNPSEVIVHRIVQVSTASDGSILVQTKGDANRAPDPGLIKQSAHGVADRALYVVPGLGTVASDGRSVLLIILSALLMTYLLRWARRRYLAIVGSEA